MTTSIISLRPLEPGDPAVISTAFGAIGWDKPVEQYDRYLIEQEAGSRHVIVALFNGEFAGYGTLNWQPTYPPYQAEGIPEIQDVNVLTQFRRRGIGSALLDAAEVFAKRTVASVGIRVGLDPGYGAAQRLYVRRGYVPDGRGVAYHDRTIEYGEQVAVDDDLVLCFTKKLETSQ